MTSVEGACLTIAKVENWLVLVLLGCLAGFGAEYDITEYESAKYSQHDPSTRSLR